MRLFLQWLFNVWSVFFSKRARKEVSKLREVNKPTGTFFKPTDNIWQQGLPSKEKRIKNRNKRKGT
mgnify:CR=1 FL=1